MMQAMRKLWRNLPAKIPVLCYGTVLCLWILSALVVLCGDAIGSMRGTKRQLTFAQENLLLENMIVVDDLYAAVTPDPQFHWVNTENMRVRTLTMQAEYNIPAGEICLYYTTQAEESFGQVKRVFPREVESGVYEFVLPQVDIHALRLDPCSDYCVISNFSATLNTPYAGWRYFIPTAYQGFYMLLLTGLCAAALSILRDWYGIACRCLHEYKHKV